jgi:hypothetical protein
MRFLVRLPPVNAVALWLTIPLSRHQWPDCSLAFPPQDTLAVVLTLSHKCFLIEPAPSAGDQQLHPHRAHFAVYPPRWDSLALLVSGLSRA